MVLRRITIIVIAYCTFTHIVLQVRVVTTVERLILFLIFPFHKIYVTYNKMMYSNAYLVTTTRQSLTVILYL